MTEVTELRTPRLRLRAWRAEDREPFAAMNADPRVMEFYSAPLSPAESDALVDRIGEHFAAHGFGLWAMEIPDVAPFGGYVGLAVPRFTAHFTPCVEIGWRLDASLWGRGYATEAARAVLAYGFETLGLDEIVSFTTEKNLRSRRVMERIGMTHDPTDDFDHPSLATTDRLRRHVLYRAARQAPSPQPRSGGLDR
jgi:RimJ/RimL family protein N-acetyltransferase